MYNSSLGNNTPGRLNQYLFNDILQATPQQLLIKVYDFAIVNCQKKNMVKTNDAIQVLINALNFEEEEAKKVSVGLFRLYQFCQEQMRKSNYDLVNKILSELRESWINAFSK